MFSWHGAAFPRVRNSKRWKCHCPLWCSFWSHTSLLLQYSMGHTVHPWFRERRDYIRAWIPRVEDHWGLTWMLTTREKTKWSTRTRPLHGHEQMESSTKAEGIVLVRCTERSSVATIFRCNCRRVGRSGGSWSIFSSIFFFFLLLGEIENKVIGQEWGLGRRFWKFIFQVFQHLSSDTVVISYYLLHHINKEKTPPCWQLYSKRHSLSFSKVKGNQLCLFCFVLFSS